MNNYAPEGKWMWDSWFINVDDKRHLFHLQADITDDSSKRHRNGVSIGHAISTDYKNWQELPTALEPSGGQEWDGANLWSGCVAEKDSEYYLYYTGITNQSGMENVQKIGIAASDDLLTWTKYSENPILEADDRYYEMSNDRNELGNIGSWRDPFVFKDPHSEKRYMSISARGNGGRREYNGCVALAESDDMVHWRVLPPIFTPGVYDEIEVTKVIYHKGLYYLFFTTHASCYEPEFARIYGAHEGLHCYYSDNLFRGYKPVNGNGVVLGNGDGIYNVRFLHEEDGDFIGIGWLNFDADHNFIGKLSHPIKLQINRDSVSLR